MSRSKYGNRITEVNGIRFHSKREAERYEQLRLMEAAGAINDLAVLPGKQYTTFVYRSGRAVIVEKGAQE